MGQEVPKKLRPSFLISGCGSQPLLDTVVYLFCSAGTKTGAGRSLERGTFWRGRDPGPSFGGPMKSSRGRVFGQLESATGSAGQFSLPLTRSRISPAKTKAWNQLGSIFSALEQEGGGETLTWESVKSAWSPHRNMFVRKICGGARGPGRGLRPWDCGCSSSEYLIWVGGGQR